MAYATIIIDMQEDFFSHELLMEKRGILTDNINQLSSISRASGAQVVWVKQEFSADLSDAPLEVRDNKIEITVAGTTGSKLLAELNIEDKDLVLVKKRYSAFFRTSLEETLRKMNCSTIIAAGINSHACVRTSVIDAYQYNYRVFLASDCIESYDSEHHEISMRYMSERIGPLKTNKEVQEILLRAWCSETFKCYQ